MQRLTDSQCRRCGRTHDALWQIVDNRGCWALTSATCECGHHWTMLYTAPANLSPLRAWIARGCEPEESPVMADHGHAWHTYRLEGVSPALTATAS